MEGGIWHTELLALYTLQSIVGSIEARQSCACSCPAVAGAHACSLDAQDSSTHRKLYVVELMPRVDCARDGQLALALGPIVQTALLELQGGGCKGEGMRSGLPTGPYKQAAAPAGTFVASTPAVVAATQQLRTCPQCLVGACW